MHVYRSNAAVIISCVVINASARIIAGGVDGNLIFAVRDLAASSLLLDRAQNMKELADALLL